MKKFKSARFGELAYEEQDVIFLPDGLVGMPALQNWLMLDMDEGIPLKWFHSLDRPDFCLPISEPFYFSDDYQVKIPPEVQTRLGVESAADVAVAPFEPFAPWKGGSALKVFEYMAAGKAIVATGTNSAL